MDFKGPVRRDSTCFKRHMSYMQQGIELIAEVRGSGDLDALHLEAETFKAYLIELTYFRSRCHDLSQEQEEAFDSKMNEFVYRYRLLLRDLAKRN